MSLSLRKQYNELTLIVNLEIEMIHHVLYTPCFVYTMSHLLKVVCPTTHSPPLSYFC